MTAATQSFLKILQMLLCGCRTPGAGSYFKKILQHPDPGCRPCPDKLMLLNCGKSPTCPDMPMSARSSSVFQVVAAIFDYIDRLHNPRHWHSTLDGLGPVELKNATRA